MKTLLTFFLCLLAVCSQAANPSTKSFRATGGLLVTSNDVTGIITYDGSGIAGPTNGITLLQATGIVNASFIQATTNIVWVSKGGNNTTGARNRMDLPYANVAHAMAGALTGDQIVVMPGVYSEGTSNIIIKPFVSIRGFGINVTWIQTGVDLNTNGCFLVPTMSNTVANMTIDGVKKEFFLQGLIGATSAATNGQASFTNLYVESVRMIGGTDVVFVQHTNKSSAVLRNCILEADYDTFAVKGGSVVHDWQLLNCKLTSDMAGTTNSYTIAAGIARGLLFGPGRLLVEGCTIIATNANTIYGIQTGGVDTRIVVEGGTLDCAGTNTVSVLNSSLGGTISYGGHQYSFEVDDGTGGIQWLGTNKMLARVYYPNSVGLVFSNDDVGVPAPPIFISGQGGLNIGDVSDPGPMSLQVNGDLSLPALTASRPLFLNAFKIVTTATGTPDGTKFLRDDGVLAVPAGSGGGNFSTNAAGFGQFYSGIQLNALNADGVLLSLKQNLAPNSNVIELLDFSGAPMTFAVETGGVIVSPQVPRNPGAGAANMLVANNESTPGSGNSNSRTNKTFIGTNGIVIHHSANLIVASNSLPASGVTNLNDLYDVGIGTLHDFDALFWIASMGIWTNYSPFFQINFNITNVNLTNIIVGVQPEQLQTITTNASFRFFLTGTPMNGEIVKYAISNYSASVIFATNTTGIYDVNVASNVTTFAVAGNSIRWLEFISLTNMSLGVQRWEMRQAMGKEVELAVAGSLTIHTNTANSIITVSNALDAVTNIANGWGMGSVLSSAIITESVSNSVTLIASNAATAQIDFTTTPDYVSTDVMRANISLQITNPVQGRLVTVYLTGDTNANNRTVTVSTNGFPGNCWIHWNFNTPTNGSSDFTVTNNMRAELSLKSLGRDSFGTNHIWAVWGPVR